MLARQQKLLLGREQRVWWPEPGLPEPAQQQVPPRAPHP